MSAAQVQIMIILSQDVPTPPTVERLIAMNIVILILIAIVYELMREKK